MKLSKRIRTWREAKGLSRAELAEVVGVTPAAVYQWEGGKSGTSKTVLPSTSSINAITAALGISLERFYGEPPARKRAA